MRREAAAHGGLFHVGVDNQRRLETNDPRAWFDITCPRCGREASSAVIAFTSDGNFQPVQRFLRCVSCGGIAVHDGESVSPSVLEGRPVKHLPPTIDRLYNEARASLGVGASTGCELLCRTILSHVADHLGWDGKGQFAGAVDFITDSGYVTIPMKPWVDRIRTNANEAAHEIKSVAATRARDTLAFAGTMLHLVFELPELERSAGEPDE